MKATGVVRRIDDLGRIVIPKELRRTMRIKEGESLEIYTDGEDRVVLKKYSPILNAYDFVKEYAESIYNANKCNIVITDTEKIIACAGNYRKDIVGKKLSLRLIERLYKRNTQIITSTDNLELCEYVNLIKPAIIKPINIYGDIIGSVIVSNELIGEVEKSIVELSGEFLSKYLEG